MHSFTTIATALTVAGAGIVAGRAVQAPTAVVTPAPTVLEHELIKRQDPDAISLAQVLITAVPESLRQVAATNVPAVSSILWEEFLDDKKPDWFLELPWDIQAYLIKQFGPSTAIPAPTSPVGSSAAFSWPPVETEPVQTESSQPGQTGPTLPAETSPTQSQDGSSSIPESTSEESTVYTSPQSTSSDTPTTMSTETGTTASTDTASPTEEASSSSSPTLADSPSVLSAPGLTKGQKVGIGLGVSLGLIGAAALIIGVCILLRRRQRKKIDGSIPPSSPGFIPRFAFQEKPTQEPNQRLLNPADSSFSDLHNMAWEEEVVDTSSSGESVPTLNNTQLYNNGNQPIMAPALFHTHSSNRARGKRTSYTSLHSVAEVSEPDDDRDAMAESPVLPRSTPPKRYSPPRSLIPLPTPAASQSIKRKPVGSIHTRSPAAAHLASQTLLHQTMPGPNSVRPRPRLSTTFEEPSASSSRHISPYVSPLEEHHPSSSSSSFLPTALHATTHSSSASHTRNHNNNSPSTPYEEDYGPEYYEQQQPPQPPPQPAPRPHMHKRRSSTASDTIPSSSSNDAYIDILYGGNTDLSRYPEPSSASPRASPRSKSSRTEWPLRNFSSSKGKGHARNKSPLWDRVYESP